MAPTASALPDSLAADPGAEQSCWIQIRNGGDVVDEFVFEVLGDAAGWTELEPSTLSLLPGTEGELKLTFRPPRLSTTPSGPIPYGLRISSKENPDDTLVEEGTLVVAPFTESSAELVPRTSHGRLAAKHELAFDNRGNVALDGVLEGRDQNDALTFGFRPPTLAAVAGTATFAKLKVRPRKRQWRGQPKTHPFAVQVTAQDQPPVTVDGVMVQQALIPRWLVPAVLGLAALAALWALVLQPNVRSTAREASKDQQQKVVVKVQANTAAISGLQRQANALQKKVDALAAVKPSVSGGGSGNAALIASVAGLKQAVAGLQKKRPVVNNSITTTPKGTATGARLVVDCGPTCTKSYTVAKGSTFSLTDIVLGNPQGDSGTLTLKRGDDVLFVESLDNFRDLDFHFIAPIVVKGGQALTLDVDCKNSTSNAVSTSSAPQSCTDAVYVAGFTSQTPAKSQTKPAKKG